MKTHAIGINAGWTASTATAIQGLGSFELRSYLHNDYGHVSVSAHFEKRAEATANATHYPKSSMCHEFVTVGVAAAAESDLQPIGEAELFLSVEQAEDLRDEITRMLDERPVHCGTCDGAGVLIVGHERDTRDAQGDPIEMECDVCRGEGHIPFLQLFDEHDGTFPTAETAIEDMRCEMQDRASDATGCP